MREHDLAVFVGSEALRTGREDEHQEVGRGALNHSRESFGVVREAHALGVVRQVVERVLLERHARRSAIASQRSAQGYDGADVSYRLLLRDAGRTDELITELKAFPGVSRVTSLKAEDESEV